MDKVLGRLSLLSGSLGVGAVALNTCIYNVDGGQRAVIFNQFKGGVQPKVIGEGTHFIIPFVETPIIMNVRSTPWERPSSTGTKDLQTVDIKLRVLYRPVESELPKLYKELGVDYQQKILPSIVNETLKSIVAQYDAAELLSKRSEVSTRIKSVLEQRCKAFHFQLDDVAITHLTFGREFVRAIESKQVASQMAERQRWVVKKAEQEAQAIIIRAEGEAEAASMVTDAIEKSGNAIIEVRRIDAAKVIAKKLANSRNIVYLPSGGGKGSDGPGLLLGIDNK